MSAPNNLLLLLTIATVGLQHTLGYSALEDARTIAQYKTELAHKHAKIARQLVHQSNWAAVGSISTRAEVLDYPMVNVVSVDDNDSAGKSTGKIRFVLTDLDLTGKDWHQNNKVTFLFTDEQMLNCQKRSTDPMEPTCARVIISGHVTKLSNKDPNYKTELRTFKNRHPAAKIWFQEHSFYLCELDIKNIFVLDFYGGAHKVKSADYYNEEL